MTNPLRRSQRKRIRKMRKAFTPSTCRLIRQIGWWKTVHDLGVVFHNQGIHVNIQEVKR